MNKKLSILIALVLVLVLAMPAVVFAKGQNKGGGDKAPHGNAAKKQEAREEKAAAKAEKKAQKQARKDARSTEASESDAPEEFEPIETGNRNVAGAMVRITSNLERALEKVTAGTKKQLPPGLIKVWDKFAAWLGIDPTTRPGYVAPVDSSPTTDATSTVEPTATVDPTPTVEPIATVAPD